jgi:peptide/nickel transport system substrate-binding protein
MYTFTLRRGLRFSDGRPLTAANYEAAAYRLFHPKMQSLVLLLGGGNDIVGVRELNSGKASRLVGVRAHGRQLVVRLTRPNPDILNRLATTAMCPVPVGYPLDPAGVTDPPVPGSGPYFIASHTPGVEVVLRRNPYYRGSRPHNLGELQVLIGGTREDNAAAVERRDLDYSFDGSPADPATLITKYGVNRGRLWIKTRSNTAYLAFNTGRPLFKNNAPLRRAVNFALDRSEIVQQAGYVQAGRPTDQLLPPSMPGFRNVDLYPLDKPDLESARRLASGHLRGAHAILYVSDVSPADRRARIIQSNLAEIGLQVEVKVITLNVLLYRLSQPNEPYDLVYTGWSQDYPDPTDFLVPILHSRSIPKGSPATLAEASFDHNYSRLADRVLDRRLNAAASLSDNKRLRAFSNIEIDTLRTTAPIAPLFNPTEFLFFSDRVGCVTYSPVFGIDLAALCEK